MKSWIRALILIAGVVLTAVACSVPVQQSDIEAYIDKNIRSSRDLEKSLKLAKESNLSPRALIDQAREEGVDVESVVEKLKSKGISDADIKRLSDIYGLGLSTKASSAPVTSGRFSDKRSALVWDRKEQDVTPEEMPGFLQWLSSNFSGPFSAARFLKYGLDLQVITFDLNQSLSDAVEAEKNPETAVSCPTRVDADVCIIQKLITIQFADGQMPGCRSTRNYGVKNPEEIRAALSDMNKSCLNVKSLAIWSHGSPGGLMAGLSIVNVQSTLSGFSEMFAPRAEVKLNGCNIGYSCLGSIMMLKTSRALLRSKGGSVQAPTNYILINGNSERSNLDWQYKRLTMTPSSGGNDWQEQGILSNRMRSLMPVCQSPIQDFIVKINAARSRPSCSKIKAGIVKPEVLDSMSASLSKLAARDERSLTESQLNALARAFESLERYSAEISKHCGN